MGGKGKAEAVEVLQVDGREVRITHPDKPYFSRQVKLSKIAPLTFRIWIILLVLSIYFGEPRLAHAGKLRKVWEVDLKRLVHATNGIDEFPVFALRFSPDGRKLAVIADIYRKGEEWKSRLLISDVGQPTAKLQEFEVDFGIIEDEHGRGHALNFGWTPSGDSVYAVGKVIHTADGSTCELPNQSVFISDDLAVHMDPEPRGGIGASTHVRFFSQRCEERGQWDVPENWTISDVSTDRGLLSILRFSTTAPLLEGSAIVDPAVRRILQRWPVKDTWGPAWEFADNGNVVCMAGNDLASDRAPAVCRDVDTGKEISKTKINGAEPIATAARAKRFVVSDYRRRKVPFDYEYTSTFHGRYVWGFGTGQNLASWHPESETYPMVLLPPEHITEPFRFAISPDGQYVAEGGDGKLRLYKIEP